ncbi:MAG: aminopeptidase P family protein [Lachnospiraceae bacterium]|nr:aminopeptidase P family protein [Lachnospiraceae bacterium]
MATIYKTRINLLQTKLKELNIDYFIISDADPHHSEYVCDYYKMRSAFSGFTGSNGTLLVGREDSCLWTDGRYFIQAEKELAGSDVVLMRMGEKGVPTVRDFLAQRSEEGEGKSVTIGCDGSCMMKGAMDEIKETLETAGKKADFYFDGKLAREILKETGAEEKYFISQSSKIRILPDSLQGKRIDNNIQTIRDALNKAHADVFLSAKLDSNMYLFNIRGEDITYNPVAFSYVLVTAEAVVLFVKDEAVTDELKSHANRYNILLESYDCFAEKLAFYTAGKTVMTESVSLSAKVYEVFTANNAKVLEGDCGVALLQAVKSVKEINLIKDIYLKDSVAVCKFLYWLSKQTPGTITEYNAACKMDALRGEIPGNRGLSFNTISAFGANAAMMHYETSKEACATIEEGNVYLLDSGGQYDGGTTDVTRTVVIGEPTEEMKQDFTRVVRGMLALQDAVFMKGCTGMNLDILARKPMWEVYMDYKCGTGHGIGYMLNVHEGPQAIRMRGTGIAGTTEFEPGMLVSDEPGVYLEGKYGIRMENILLCEEACENGDGTFLCFYPLTYVPVDMRLIDKMQMEPKEWRQLCDYQQAVYEKIAPFLTEEERKWLEEETLLTEEECLP